MKQTRTHMYFRLPCILALVFCLSARAGAQELQARVTVMAQRVYNTVDKKTFTTLQNQLTNFLNTRKWTADVFAPQEKIQCHFLLNIESSPEPNVYKASLTVQAARPVFNAAYLSPLVNFLDNDVTFKYIEFQPVEFNENRVQGNDPLVANLTAVFAYYANIILGFDYASFSPKGGMPYFQKALAIVNNAPEGRNISGWRAFDGLRNRYWLAENMVNTKYNVLHDALYAYYREGLDLLYSDESSGRAGVLQALNRLHTFNQENPNTMFMQFFLQGRAQELIGVLKKATVPEKRRAADMLAILDIPNANTYKQELK